MMNLLKKLPVVLLFLMFLCEDSLAQNNRDILDQHADQAQGNYAATNLNYLSGGALGMTQSAWKDPLQHMGEGQSRPGYTKYYWSPELVLPVRLREGMYTLINFPSWEVIEQVYLGDSQSFNAEPYGPSSLMVYPEVSQFLGVDTNMIVFGRSGNKYVFYVQSEAFNTDRITNAIIDIEVIKDKNSKGGSSAAYSNSGGYLGGGASGGDTSVVSNYTRDMQKEDWIEKIPVDPTKFRFDIEVYVPNPDDIIIAPERVWRDNIFTYIDLGEKALTAIQRPIVTLIVERSETPVGFRSAGPNNRLIIVEGMGDMVLRSGKRIVCLKLRRADSDGLEHAIYAKSNEWDIQADHMRQNNEGGANSQIEDVYNDTSSTNDIDARVSDENADFFTSNSFMKNNQSSSHNNGVVSGISPTSFQENNEANGCEDKESIDEIPGLNSLPKVSPIIAPQKESGIQPLSAPMLTGQYDVKTGDSEFIIPEYNNQNNNINVSYQKDEGVSLGIAPQSVNSTNNSNPVLIRTQPNHESSNTLISAETEALLKEFRDGKAFEDTSSSNISIELGTDENVNNLEKLWSDISRDYAAAIGKYQPFYSVDTATDGQGKEMFHLRVGPIKSLEEGDNICSQLGRNGIFCSVVRIQ